MHEGSDHPTKEAVAATFGVVLRRRRTSRGLTQERLAEAAGVTPTFVSMMERGQYQPSLHTVVSLANALGVGVGDLGRDLDAAIGSGPGADHERLPTAP
jgi:transcriptional regulator with XRE-family HTH domain